ncbi:Cell division trigger factor [hydrothermal vent metagenome]|uniref:peptidylprolyl isomerase n=1 Tax=hydrothermal vent metagenome TaxID=652676 RepID=A0A3B0TKZ5_9ZZZZ
MNVTETLNEGLKRKLEVTIPAADLKSAQDAKLNELKAKANLKGFRPGKVPMSYLKSVYGQSVMSEVMQETINRIIQEALAERKEKAAMQPKIDLSEDQAELNRVMAGTGDLAFAVSYEVLPEFELMDFKSIKIEKPVVTVSDEDVTREMERIFSEQRQYEDRDESDPIVDGDRVGLNFVGKIDGEPFEGGASDHAHVVIGAGQYIPGFEEQLIGMKKGDKGEIKLTFPEDYAQPHLAGKDAVFEVEILHVGAPSDEKLDDEFAKKLGVEDLAAFKDVVTKQIQATHETMARQRVKRLVLDALDEGHKFDLPSQLVQNEFDSIWKRVVDEMEQSGQSFESEGTTEEKAREQYQKIAERRVRLGLVVAEVGNSNKIEVSEEEHQQALIAEVRRFPGQEQEVYDYYRKTPEALAGLRAPVFENKVVDFVVELAETSEVEVTRQELNKLIEALEEE